MPIQLDQGIAQRQLFLCQQLREPRNYTIFDQFFLQ